MTVFESILSAYVTALNTARPASVPVIERDRWIDVETGPTSAAVIALTGWEDEPIPDQNPDRPLDFRRARLVFEIYASTTTTVSAVTVVDAALEWIGSKCGPVDTGSIATAGAVRLTFLKRAVVIGKGNTLRCLAEVAIDYRNKTNDLTLVK
jgi:hypothetical protein